MSKPTLWSRVAGEFDSHDKHHGEVYFRHGAVRILGTGPEALEADVDGSRQTPYRVRMAWDDARDGVVYVECSCPRFSEMGICKHVAALILAADMEGIGPTVPGRNHLYLEQVEFGPDEFGDYDEDDGDDGELDEEYWEDPDAPDGRYATGSSIAARSAGRPKSARQAPPPAWKRQLSVLTARQQEASAAEIAAPGRPATKPRQFWYLLDLDASLQRGRFCVSLGQRTVKKDGTLGKLSSAKVSRAQIAEVPSEEDRTLLGLLIGNQLDSRYSYDYESYQTYNEFAIAPAMCEVILPRLCASGRFGLSPSEDATMYDDIRPLAWDDGPAWKLHLRVSKTEDMKHWQLHGNLARGTEAEQLSRPLLLLAEGFVIFPDRIARFDSAGGFQWVAALRETGSWLVPVKQQDEFVATMAELPSAPAVEWPGELKWEEVCPAPIPQLTISKPKQKWEQDLNCLLAFEYGERSATWGTGPAAWYDQTARSAVRRDPAAENQAREQLLAAGAVSSRYQAPGNKGQFTLKPAKMPGLVRQLATAGWRVEAEGNVFRQAGKLSLSVESGVDWFDLDGSCDFGGVSASLPRLLAALRKGEQFVQLDDGSQGMLPEDWLGRFANLVELGEAEGDRVRFRPSQAALLDALLAAQESQQVAVDETFIRLRDKLHSFEGIEPCAEPPSFTGELRPYQREGLGWLHFLDDFAFGGCLADDMGFGKTIQVLALLEERRQQRAACNGATAEGAAPEGKSHSAKGATDAIAAPSLAVVPRSLIFNWIEEAKRFAPDLRVLRYVGSDRHAEIARLHEHDLIITTYGTLRRDIAKFGDVKFDYAILDEAQAIKNASSQSAKACRLLQARRRLAMTGTPVENHLGELWSLFEFLNPGMLGRNKKLHESFSSGGRKRGSNGKPENGDGPSANVALLSQALRPFMLRRTKQQVLKDLPEKTEQTLYCELDGPERKMYDELRDHYRQSLLERVKKVGVNKSKIHVLEALLRLRQAACHPGLLDKKQVGAESSKLNTLLEQLSEIIAEGHKALVFSQFTSLLAIVRRQLDARKIVYEYLDGKTAKRQEKVERFQTDADCPLFLISLKAGGQGLNLTAADYVFILDPWWNPAVEAQAVDRAHRIGQDRHVFAYRLIARDTVEEKIVQLQEKKRDLADAIISADNSPLRNLTADDLQLLLG